MNVYQLPRPLLYRSPPSRADGIGDPDAHPLVGWRGGGAGNQPGAVFPSAHPPLQRTSNLVRAPEPHGDARVGLEPVERVVEALHGRRLEDEVGDELPQDEGQGLAERDRRTCISIWHCTQVEGQGLAAQTQGGTGAQ